MSYLDPLTQIARGAGFVDSLFANQTRRNAGSRLAAGDVSGASNVLFQAGDLEGGQQLATTASAQATTDRQRQTEGGLRVVRALREAQAAGQDLGSAFDSYAPFLSQLGLEPGQAQQIRAMITADPRSLDQFERILGQQAAEWEFRDGGAGDVIGVRQTPTGGIETQVAYDAPDRPISTPYGIILPPSSPVGSPSSAPASVGADGAPASGGQPVDTVAVIQSIIPGVSFNSGLRTEDQNRGAGGSPTSYHLTGMAVDIPPQPGRDIGEFRRQLEAAGVRVRELIDEGDHWHIAWEGGPAAPNFGRGEAPRSGGQRAPIEQSSPSGAQDLGGGWSLQPLQTGADRRAERAEGRAERAEIRAEESARRAAAQTVTLSPQEVEALGLPAGAIVQRRPDGSISVINNRSERFTEGQRLSASFYHRALGASQNLERLSANGGRPSPAVLAFGEGRLRENALSPADRQWVQASRDWLAPILRRDTGAAVSPGELVTYMGTYIPNPTDDPATLRQKAESRRRAQEGLRGTAGGAYEELLQTLGTPQGGRPQTNAPGLPFNITDAQLRTRREIVAGGADPSAPLGSSRNPRYLNPQDPSSGWNNARPGDYVVRPDGRVTRKP